MKNKSTTYFLIFGVLAIWGGVFYRIFSGINTDEEVIIAPVKNVLAKVPEKEEAAFLLLGNYRDPFLGTTSNALASNNPDGLKRVRMKKPEVKKEVIVIDWSFIDYIGIVQNKETAKKVGLVVLSGKEYMVNENDLVNEVLILKKERDSIFVQYKETKKWIRR